MWLCHHIVLFTSHKIQPLFDIHVWHIRFLYMHVIDSHVARKRHRQPKRWLTEHWWACSDIQQVVLHLHCVITSDTGLRCHPIMKHDLILLDRKPIQKVIVSQVRPLFPRMRGTGLWWCWWWREGVSSWKTIAEEEIAVGLCRGRGRTLDSPSLLLPERLITEAGQSESW